MYSTHMGMHECYSSYALLVCQALTVTTHHASVGSHTSVLYWEPVLAVQAPGIHLVPLLVSTTCLWCWCTTMIRNR